MGCDVKSHAHCMEGIRKAIQGHCWSVCACALFPSACLCWIFLGLTHLKHTDSKGGFIQVFERDLIAKVLQRSSFTRDYLKYKSTYCFRCIFFVN